MEEGEGEIRIIFRGVKGETRLALSAPPLPRLSCNYGLIATFVIRSGAIGLEPGECNYKVTGIK